MQVKLEFEWNGSFQFVSYKQYYYNVYQSISIIEMKRVYHY